MTSSDTAPGGAPSARHALGDLASGVRRAAVRLCERAVMRGAPPGWFGWRWIREESLAAHVARSGRGQCEILAPAQAESHPLPRNVARREDLPDVAGWWHYSMRDVPDRLSGETLRATLPDARVATFFMGEKAEFFPVIVTADDRALALREIAFRPPHRQQLVMSDAARLERGTWFLERVYTNHSHWLTAHLPKLVLLRERGELDDLILPTKTNPVIDASFEMLGIGTAGKPVHDPSRLLEVGEMTVLQTDRFRPDLLRPVRDTMAMPPDREPWRRVFISRRRSRGRRLVNEAELDAMLARAGFEHVLMEELTFAEQIRLMGETRVLMAPHGAGLTNMMFCAPGTHVVEIADLSYPNPNFYALASAMGLPYWLIEGAFAGPDDVHALERDLRVEPAAVEAVLDRIGD